MPSAIDDPALTGRIAALSRARLEALVAASVQTGVAVAPASLAPPPAPPRATQVGTPLADADVGLFRWLDNDVLGELVHEHLDAPARLSFLTRVCKSLRALGLPWTSLKLVDGSRVRTKPTPDLLWLAPGGLANPQLEGFVRVHAPTLTRLSLNLRESPTDTRAIAKLVAAAPNVTDLALSDKRLNAPAMKALAGLPHLRKLKRFELGHGASNKPDAVKLLSGMTALEELHISNGLSAEAFHSVCRAWRSARGGGALLLERLRIDGHVMATIPTLLPALAVACPDLRELRFETYFPELPANLALPRGLRKLVVELRGFDNSRKSDEDSDRYEYRNADNASLVKRLLSAAPNLEEASIGWYKHYRQPIDWSTKWELELGDALSSVPSTLRALTLGNMNVDGGSMPYVHGLPLPTALRTLTLDGCGVTQCMLDAMERAGVEVIG